MGASVLFALKIFSQYLLGNCFILVTDNKAIKKIFDSKTEINPIAAGRLVRWSLILTQYDYELKNIVTQICYQDYQHQCKANCLLTTRHTTFKLILYQ